MEISGIKSSMDPINSQQYYCTCYSVIGGSGESLWFHPELELLLVCSSGACSHCVHVGSGFYSFSVSPRNMLVDGLARCE